MLQLIGGVSGAILGVRGLLAEVDDPGDININHFKLIN